MPHRLHREFNRMGIVICTANLVKFNLDESYLDDSDGGVDEMWNFIPVMNTIGKFGSSEFRWKV